MSAPTPTSDVPISQIVPRTVLTVSGRIAELTRSVPAGSPRLEVVLSDGTGRVRAVFMGRREIPGIETGTILRLHARFTHARGMAETLNPEYELISTAVEDVYR